MFVCKVLTVVYFTRILDVTVFNFPQIGFGVCLQGSNDATKCFDVFYCS